MKPTVADRARVIYCVRIVAENGTTVRFTAYPRDVVMAGGQTYTAGGGYDFTGQATSTRMAPPAIDLSGIADAFGISRAQVASGLFDGARLYCFATTWDAPVEDEEPIGAGILGKTRLEDDRYTVEMMNILDVLGQSVGDSYSPACQKTFGGQEFGGCGVDLATVTVSGTITHVSSQLALRDSARTEVEDYFGAGLLTITSGDNSGLAGHEVRAYAADGTITLFEPFYYPVQVGDTYTMVAGCRRRLVDCQKHGNILRFGGFPNVPTSSQYSARGTK